jgi:hypothetical protein
VFQTLRSFLQELNAQNYGGRLWIDALCINHSNQEEKSDQILNLREVYSKSQRVIIWLGIPFDVWCASHTVA